MLPAIALVILTVAAARAPESEEQLLQDILALRNGPMERPTHVDPALPGVFGPLAEQPLIALEISRKRLGTESAEQIAARRAVERGEKPTSDLRPEWQHELAATKDSLDDLLRATHAAGGRPPYLLSIFGAFGPDDDRYSGMTTQYATKLATLRARAYLEAHDAARALAICADTLAMAGDISRASIMGQMLGHASLKYIEPACRDAIKAATPTQRKSMMASVARIAKGWPTLADTLHTEMIFGQLAHFFEQLPDSTKARLPPEAQLKVPRGESGWFGRMRGKFFGGWARRKHLEEMQALMVAVALPPAAADAEADRIAGHSLAFTLAGMNNGTPSPWSGLLRRVRESLAYLVRLQTIGSLLQAKDALGRWPTDWAEVDPHQPIDPRTGLAFTIRSGLDTIVLSAPSDGPRTEDNLQIELR